MPAGAELLKSSFLLDGEQENIKKDSDLYAEIKEVLDLIEHTGHSTVMVTEDGSANGKPNILLWERFYNKE